MVSSVVGIMYGICLFLWLSVCSEGLDFGFSGYCLSPPGCLSAEGWMPADFITHQMSHFCLFKVDSCRLSSIIITFASPAEMDDGG